VGDFNDHYDYWEAHEAFFEEAEGRGSGMDFFGRRFFTFEGYDAFETGGAAMVNPF